MLQVKSPLRVRRVSHIGIQEDGDGEGPVDVVVVEQRPVDAAVFFLEDGIRDVGDKNIIPLSLRLVPHPHPQRRVFRLLVLVLTVLVDPFIVERKVDPVGKVATEPRLEVSVLLGISLAKIQSGKRLPPPGSTERSRI